MMALGLIASFVVVVGFTAVIRAVVLVDETDEMAEAFGDVVQVGEGR